MKFERIYSPMEKAIKQKLNNRRASLRYSRNHPERRKLPPHVRAIYKRRWKERHPDSDQIRSKKLIRNMKTRYLVQLLRQHGRPVTPETLALKRAELQAYRTRKLFRMFYATNKIAA
jgi:hypothetical protein